MLLPFNIITSLQVIPPVVQEIGDDSVSVDGSNSNDVVEDEDVSGLDCVPATLAGCSSKRKPSRLVGQRKSTPLRTGFNGQGNV